MSKKARPPIPLLDGKIIETHCHLDYLDDEQLKDTLAKARAVGVERVITIAVSRTNQHVVREIAESSDDVWCTQGLHPHEASTWDASFSDDLTTTQSTTGSLPLANVGLITTTNIRTR